MKRDGTEPPSRSTSAAFRKEKTFGYISAATLGAGGTWHGIRQDDLAGRSLRHFVHHLLDVAPVVTHACATPAPPHPLRPARPATPT
eukprot:6416305-Pyramimonas_sp.AAC.1